jgi:peptidoglycan/xylan/chitin deacetylase (PgdA/CDA1 family)
MAHTTDDEHDLPETKMFSNKEQIELKRITRHSPTATLLPDRPSTLEPIDVHFIEHGDRQLPFVALTFDLCQMPSNPSGFDREIVDVLMQTQTPATFFLGGDWMRTHVEETRQLAEIQYFELGNHSWSHPDFRELEEVEMSREIMRTQSTLFELTGRTSRLFRFPAGTYNALALSVVAWHGLRSIQWDVVSADPVPDNTAEMINERVRERVRSGSIIIMHANGRGWHTAEALPDMIKFLRGQGYCLVTVSQLLGIDPLPGSCGNDQPPARSGHVLPADQWNK